jgi:hypothetical protein
MTEQKLVLDPCCCTHALRLFTSHHYFPFSHPMPFSNNGKTLNVQTFDRNEIIPDHFRHASHPPSWSRKRDLAGQQSAPSESLLPQPCSYLTLHPSGDDDDPTSRAANWTTSVHSASAGLQELPQPLPSDAVYLFVQIACIHTVATLATTTSPRCPWMDL